MSDTPRCDKDAATICDECANGCGFKVAINAELGEQLERELAEAKTQLAKAQAKSEERKNAMLEHDWLHKDDEAWAKAMED